jgi:hypothetical protein
MDKGNHDVSVKNLTMFLCCLSMEFRGIFAVIKPHTHTNIGFDWRSSDGRGFYLLPYYKH